MGATVSGESTELHFDVAITPFSSRGSWLNLSPVVGYHDRRDHVFLISHKTKINPVLRFVLDGDREAGTWDATPSVLTWRGPEGQVEIAFDSPSRLRARIRGVALTLEGVVPRTGAMFSIDAYIDERTRVVVFTVEETGQRYRVTASDGQALIPHGLYEGAIPGDVRAPSLTVNSEDEVELYLEEMEGIEDVVEPNGSFEDAVERQRLALKTYTDTIAPFAASSGAADTAALAAYIDWAMTVSADGFLTREAMLMSKHWMDKTWSWDHCFNALAITALGSKAWDQFWIMFDHQTEAGQIPDSVAHSERRYNYVKPPIHGLMLRVLLDRLPEQPSTAQLRESYQKLAAWTRWWRTAMTAPGEILSHYYFGNDSGWDNSTAFDGFRPVQTADLNAFLILQAEVLAELARSMGRHADAGEWDALSRELLHAVQEQLWDGTRFVIREPGSGRTRWSPTLLLAMPIVLGNRLPAETVRSLVATLEAHLTEYGLATERPDSADYESDGYWRGPVWAPTTYLVWLGLREAGEQALADRVRDSFLDLCKIGAFAENFDALTGQGLRDRAYTWTSSVYLLLLEDAVRQPGAGTPA